MPKVAGSERDPATMTWRNARDTEVAGSNRGQDS